MMIHLTNTRSFEFPCPKLVHHARRSTLIDITHDRGSWLDSIVIGGVLPIIKMKNRV